MATFGERLKRERAKTGLTQKQVASKLGIREQAYGYYEQGVREPSHSSLIKLSQIFNVSVDYLLGVDDLTPNDLAFIRDLNRLTVQELKKEYGVSEEEIKEALDIYTHARNVMNKGEKERQ